MPLLTDAHDGSVKNGMSYSLMELYKILAEVRVLLRKTHYKRVKLSIQINSKFYN
jgi:hypothetical protein